jgi:hypothetical protein
MVGSMQKFNSISTLTADQVTSRRTGGDVDGDGNTIRKRG